MDDMQIEGRDVVTGDGICVLVKEGCIHSIRPARVHEGHWISAGLVDLQVNGFCGFDLNTDAMDTATVSALTRQLLAVGVTTFAPTVITASREQILSRVRAIAEARNADSIAAACIPFVHIEGPHISPVDGYRGAHPLEHVRPPSIEEFDAWQQASGNLVGLVTLSPHFDESADYITSLVRRGVRVSIGHTHATEAQIHMAVEAGASLSTHLGNGAASTMARHPNPIWSQLAEDRLQATFIADGHHLPAEVLKVMLRAKTIERSILVSDAVALAGMPPGRYSAPIGGEVELLANGRLGMVGTQSLAGAALPLIECIGNAIRMTGLPLVSVLKMASENPGKLISPASMPRGQLLPGMRADLLQFSWDQANCKAHVEKVWLAGEQVF